MGSSSQLYSLSWGEFSSSLVSSVQLLRGHGDLVDVTLAAGGRSFPAHKIVLCAASPFLLDLLKSTPCQHPVVMLAGIGADDLESLLEFVYRGEVSVEPSQLPSLLQAAHCLCIHGLTPPTIVTENGEEIPASAIPAVSDSVSRATLNSYYPLKRRKKRRKSSSSSGKWGCGASNTTDSESRPIDGHDNNRTLPYENKDDDTTDQTDDTAGNCVEYANNHRGSNHSPRTQESSVADNHQTAAAAAAASAHQDQGSDGESHSHTMMPMQGFSPLHVPQFPGSMGYPGLSAITAGLSQSKARGASDCPGMCPLCGATLRQARNLRRHLLSSCKYRFSNHSAAHGIGGGGGGGGGRDSPMMMEVKPEIESSAYNDHTTRGSADSGGSSNSCEQIVCKPLLSQVAATRAHSPGSAISSHRRTASPTIAR